MRSTFQMIMAAIGRAVMYTGGVFLAGSLIVVMMQSLHTWMSYKTMVVVFAILFAAGFIWTILDEFWIIYREELAKLKARQAKKYSPGVTRLFQRVALAIDVLKAEGNFKNERD